MRSDVRSVRLVGTLCVMWCMGRVGRAQATTVRDTAFERGDASRYPVTVPYAWPTSPAQPGSNESIEQCAAVIARAAFSLDRAQVPPGRDTGGQVPTDSLHPELRKIARSCFTRWSVDETEPFKLTTLRGLAILAGDDSVASHVTRRQLRFFDQQGVSVITRVDFIRSIIEQLLHLSPVRATMIYELASMADGLTPQINARTASDSSLLVYREVLKAQGSVHVVLAEFARRLVNLDAMQYEGNRLVAIGVALGRSRGNTPSDSIIAAAWVGIGVYYMRDVAWLRLSPGATKAQVVAAVLAGSPALQGQSPELVARVVGERSPLLDQPAPSIVGTYRFPAGTTPIPAPGIGAVLAFVDGGCDGACRPYYQLLRRIQSRFPTVPLTLIAHIQGQIRSRPPESAVTEAELIRAFFLDSLHLAPQLVIDTTVHLKLAAPDRRYILSLFPTVDAYAPWVRQEMLRGENALVDNGQDEYGRTRGMVFGGFLVIIDSHGRVIFNEAVDTDKEAFVMAVLDHIFGSPR